jgi:hypothetical protein
VEERFGDVNEFDFDVRLSMVERFRSTLNQKRLTPR